MATYGLIGQRLGHSFSKTIHEKLRAYKYDLIPLLPEELDKFFRDRDFKGLNVTIPYKRTVMSYCGTNTDYPGFLKAAAAAGITFKGRKVLILGDGGAGGMVRHAVKDSGASSVVVVTRHPEMSPARAQFKCVSYDRIGKFAGGGSIVPITGFANSVVSPAMEFKTEGYIYGVAAKMFVIAGPIIVFGVASSVLVGLIYYGIFNIF